ncbi:MAG: hypothetical protein A2Y10_12400 [Planctomycetes bacterium GWF2_41_51]|nr:MAG: hypothetical protein A2Y10_12400 [Planctomycetes bacterium GWF2_41_51]HBG27222.1 hypothetical protein [Phycisphaerales bacterium]
MENIISKDSLMCVALALKDIDRYTPIEQLPTGYRHIIKEVFEYEDIIIKKTNYAKNRNMDHYLFENEIYWLERLHGCGFSPELMDSFKIDEDIYILMRKIQGDNLYSVFNEHKTWNTSDFRNKLREKFNGTLEFLKRESLIHKDLRPQNIIVNREVSVFGVVDYQFCSKAGEGLKVVGLRQWLHYRKAIKGVGGEWRKPDISEFDFDTDRYMLYLIIEQLSSLESN